jgi:molybdopterin-guanine dinucleotide biosynthesis protein A
MGRDKASLVFEGASLAERVARLLAEACDEVLVASGDGRRLGALGLPQVADAHPGRGPLEGILAGLLAASNELVAVVAVDMPFASPAVLRMLASACGDHDAVIPVTDRGIEPLHAVYARPAAAPLAAQLDAGTLAVHRALDALRVRYVAQEEWRAADPSGRFASNVNLPDDLAALGPSSTQAAGDPPA